MSAVRLFGPRLWSAASVLALVFLFPMTGLAQSVYPRTDNPDASYVSSWQELQRLALRLDTLATRARDQAKMDSRHHGSEELAERMDDFAKDAHYLRQLSEERNVSSSKISDQIRKLEDDAQKVQKESVKAKRHNPQTETDWNRTVGVLDRINSQYLAANGLVAPQGTVGTYPPDRVYRNDMEGRRMMINDLDRRADDAARLAETANLEIAPEIDRLRDQIRSYQQRMDDLSLVDRRASIAHMLADARAAQADLSGSDAPAQLRDDVNAIVGTLVQLRDMNTEGAEGTRGYGPPPGVAPDRYETMNVPDLVRELDSRVARASDLAARADLDDVANEISRFQDKARDFDYREASMPRSERREAIESMLRDAQNTQRDLARRHVSGDLVSEWNGIVNLLVRMRDRV